MTKPIIGIIGNERSNAAHDTMLWSYAPSGFVNGVKTAGGLPLIIPIGFSETATDYISMVDKILLIGGQNVDPGLYGEDNQASENDFLKARDTFELALISEAVNQRKPIFSVCRGTQLMNVALGGSLYQDIENHWQNAPADSLYHDMVVEKNSKLAEIYGTSTAINSFHHQSIKQLAQDLRIIGRDPKDGTVEAVESVNPKLRFLGVQWHPELLIETRTEDQKLFNYIVNEF